MFVFCKVSEYYSPNINILQTSIDIDNIINAVKKEIIYDNIQSNKKAEKVEMFINVVNAIEDTSANLTDIALTVTNFLTKNEEM